MMEVLVVEVGQAKGYRVQWPRWMHCIGQQASYRESERRWWVDAVVKAHGLRTMVHGGV
jgi:hypothetical protein